MGSTASLLPNYQPIAKSNYLSFHYDAEGSVFTEPLKSKDNTENKHIYTISPSSLEIQNQNHDNIMFVTKTQSS
eukprot:TRINITY_DN3706_c0_g1_i1.p1 TRINITY_DN3706_c0_g1~~TRINITY_DN3706_c0_g1_i1.p1  ORF type:complete len:74 (-),score=11.06 TRINITY_DN3706_c0_g1_i1:116-337(-)